MALMKVILAVILFYYLNITQRYWYFLVSWLVNWAVIGSISWWLSRKIIRDFICKTIVSRVEPTGKAVLITGCDSGFGQMTAIELNRLGFFVFAGCLDSTGDGAKQLLELASYPNRIVNIQMNVTDPNEISAAFERVQNLLNDPSSGVNKLFAIVNNAGIGVSSPIEWGKEDSLDPYDSVIDVNTFGVIRVTRKFLPLIRKSKGRIVNLSSIAARMNINGSNAYCVSKAATAKFTEGLQEELAPFGVTAIDVNPWFVKTPLLNPRSIIKGAFKRYEESSEEIKNAYGREEGLKKVAEGTVSLLSDPNIVIQNPERVVETLIDAITSAEPDAVYRVILPGLREFVWVITDFVPWELVIYIRRLLMGLQQFKEVNVDEYLGDMVSTKINNICQSLLNRGLVKLQSHLVDKIEKLKPLLPRKQSERWNHAAHKKIVYLLRIKSNVSLLSRIYRNYIDDNLCCFIPGKVIDLSLCMMRRETCPEYLFIHDTLEELSDSICMAKEHFGEQIEPTLKSSVQKGRESPIAAPMDIEQNSKKCKFQDRGNCRIAYLRLNKKYNGLLRNVNLNSKAIKKQLTNSRKVIADLRRRLEKCESQNQSANGEQTGVNHLATETDHKKDGTW